MNPREENGSEMMEDSRRLERQRQRRVDQPTSTSTHKPWTTVDDDREAGRQRGLSEVDGSN